jgi:transposase
VPETGALSNWLASRLLAAGHPIVCVDARAAHGALKARSKSDRSDAEGLARLAQTGWCKAVRLKSRESLRSQ